MSLCLCPLSSSSCSSPSSQLLCFYLLSSLLSAYPFSIYLFSLCTLHLFLCCWIEEPHSVRCRPGIFLCPSSPILSTDTLSLPGSGSVGCGRGSNPRATTSAPLSSIQSDSALLRKSVSFTEDLLLAASGIVGLLCVTECQNLITVKCWHLTHLMGQQQDCSHPNCLDWFCQKH